MKSNLMKFFALALAAALLTLAVMSGIAWAFLIEQQLYPTEDSASEQSFLEVMTYRAAYNYALQHFAVAEGMAPEELTLLRFDRMYVPWYISEILLETAPAEGAPAAAGVRCFTHTVSELLYPIALEAGETGPDTDALPVYTDTASNFIRNQWRDYTLLYYQAPPMVVQVTVSSRSTPELQLAAFVYSLRGILPLLCILSAGLGLVCIVYLCWAAGRKPGSNDIRPGGLNRLALDVYTCAAAFGLYLGLLVLVEGLGPNLYTDHYLLMLLLSAGVGYLMCLLVVGWIFAFAAQVKADGYWWRRSVIGWCLLTLGRGIRRCRRGIRAMLRLLPVIWQWLLTAVGMVLAFCFTFYGAFMADGYIRVNSFFVLLLLGCIAVCTGIVLYGGYCFGTILKAVREMAGGNLDRKVNTANLLAAFRDCAEGINALADAAVLAAKQQMKSDRMKTELIANVSHDIKTPLTAIISYVDLLKKPHSQEEETEYLEILSRQSGRLKKLTEDLVEMSKATTGNITAELIQVDACEAVRQALGEFADKFEAAQLTVVLRQPEEAVMARADGRLTWRVLSNLLGNIVKYAQSGTRVYVDVTAQQEQALISLKNMSREQLNISADELMERFVRGDSARHTEGSGLGLSIAKGLMESQGGSLQLSVDGDLFKVTLAFPTA